MNTYLVIALYLDTDSGEPERFAEELNAPTAEAAEGAMLQEYDPDGYYDLTVAGVVELVAGEMQVVA